MPHVTTPLAFTLPEGCALTEGGQAVQTGENGRLIHWIAACPKTVPAEMPPLFATALAKQGWVQSEAGQLIVYRREDLELIFEFAVFTPWPSSYVWFAENYWP